MVSDFKDLVDILKVLSDHGFGTVNWKRLGLRLGLYMPKLNLILLRVINTLVMIVLARVCLLG